MAEGSIRPVPICLVKMMLEASIEQFFQRDILSKSADLCRCPEGSCGNPHVWHRTEIRMRQWNNPELIHNIPKKEERTMNQKIYLSEDWLFNENFQEGMTATEYPEETLQPVEFLIPVRRPRFTILTNLSTRWSAATDAICIFRPNGRASGSCSPSKGPVMTVPSISTAVRWESTIAATPPLL